jgi:hypothetical protein
MKTKKRKVTGGIVVSYEEAKAFVEQLEAEQRKKPDLVACNHCGMEGCDLEAHPGTEEEILILEHVVPCDCCGIPVCVGCADYFGDRDLCPNTDLERMEP